MNLNYVYQGDCISVMKNFDNECIDLTITSPPYDDLRNYNSKVDFKEVAKELYRITKVGGGCSVECK